MKTMPKLRLNDVAEIAHEVNRAYCQAIGDDSQPPWNLASDWQHESARQGVIFHATGDHGPEEGHESWLAQKKEEGWKYGKVKNPEKKLHPCMTSFDKLPVEQQAKDFIFRAVVLSLKNYLDLTL